MTEELVTLETAKLLKAAGFKEDVNSFYELVYKGGSGPEYEIDESYDAQNYNTDVYSISAPTQSIAQRWLRETKNLHIEISYMYENYWTYDILTIPRHDLIGLSDRPIIRYNTYEEALEEGIKECLKLI